MDYTKLDEAKRFLGIDDYPGNLFALLSNTKQVIEEKRIVLFKENLDKLSGFIGYNCGYTIICVNYNRNIGHQNFTLAHELGHMFLHKGINMSDANPESCKGNSKEQEANLFAKELLYPSKIVVRDLEYITDNKLYLEASWEELAKYINQLCITYCTSFIFTFNRLFEGVFRSYSEREEFYNRFKKSIGKFSDRFPGNSYIHVVESGHEYYQPSYEPYNYMKKMIHELVEERELGEESGQAMIDRYEELEG